jgi:predicted short-subunit dehydrogenase-like oxidoreductase (DUF2520 family)
VKSVSIVGVGRVGGAFAIGLSTCGYQIRQLVYRGNGRAAETISKKIAGSEAVRMIDLKTIDSDVVFITTRDPEIAGAAAAITGRAAPGTIVYHTSGALSSKVLAPLADSGCATGSIHPLVSISEPELGIENLRGSFFCVEGDAEAIAMADRIVEALGGRPFTIDSQYKTLYHAAAVTACGHMVALFDAAAEMMEKCGLDAADAKTILLPLVSSTIQNLERQSTAEALTGTFARADVETFVRHVQALNAEVSEELIEIYLLLGERSLELASKQGVSADRIETLRAKVAIAKSKLKW